MIFVRPYTEADLEEIKTLHKEQGLDYELPTELLPASAVIEENGKITHALLLRMTSEAYWLFDPKTQTRRQRLGRMLMLRKEVSFVAKQIGLEDVHAWLPPQMSENKCMNATLLKIGWERMLWQPYRYPL